MDWSKFDLAMGPRYLRRFGVVVTADQSLEYQQNLKGRKLALVVLSANHIGVVEKHPEKFLAAVDAAREGGYEFVRFDLSPKRSRAGLNIDLANAVR